MKTAKLALGVMFLVVLHTACTATGWNKPDSQTADQYLSQAKDLEARGELTDALEQYKLALTIAPENPAAKTNCERLSRKLIRMADDRYRLGMKYHAQGKYGLARNEFLAALKLRPDHPEAYQMLVSRQPEKIPTYIFHVVQPGESLSMIARHYYGDFRKFEAIAKFNHLLDATVVKPGQRLMIPKLEGIEFATGTPSAPDDEATYIEYALRPGESISRLAQMFYGDYRQFHIIAQFNGMEDATRVTAGQLIKIPKVAGLPFYPEAARRQLTAAATVTDVKPEDDAASASPDDSTPPPSDDDEAILAYREAGIALLREGKYEDAIFELNKAIEALPKDPETRNYIAVAYFESGKQLFGRQDFKAAREAFESSKQYDPTCGQCQTYIEKSELGPRLLHRSKGMDCFNKGRFKAAINEFEQFLKEGPQDAEIRGYLSQSFYQQALGDFTKGNYLAAKNGFESALEYDSACEKCEVYIRQSLDGFKERHYNKGVVYFGKEQLPEAIAEWEKIYEVDPTYKDVDQNLKKAKMLQEKLEKIRKEGNDRDI